MEAKYCFWSMCDGSYGTMMENCVRTARGAGVFKEFHVLADRPLEGCECYDACQLDKAHGLFKLHYLKAGMSRLNFEYFVWIDADTVFTRNPGYILDLLGRSPIHVPLETNLSVIKDDALWNGVSLQRLRELFEQEGIVNQIYFSQSAFWIVHHDAIDAVYDLALSFWHRAKEFGLIPDVSAALSYAMQILCADPERHLLLKNSHLWASDDHGYFRESLPTTEPWTWRSRFTPDNFEISPAIVHLPKSKELLTDARTSAEPNQLAVTPPS